MKMRSYAFVGSLGPFVQIPLMNHDILLGPADYSTRVSESVCSSFPFEWKLQTASIQ